MLPFRVALVCICYYYWFILVIKPATNLFDLVVAVFTRLLVTTSNSRFLSKRLCIS